MNGSKINTSFCMSVFKVQAHTSRAHIPKQLFIDKKKLLKMWMRAKASRREAFVDQFSGA